MIEQIEILSSDGIKLQAHLCTPQEDENVGLDKTLVIMVHGFPGNQKSQMNLFPGLEGKLRKKGFHSLRFDFRGCGESGGDAVDFTLHNACADFQSILAWANNIGYERFIYIGEGLGAALSLANQAQEMSCMILLWPVLDMKYLARSVFKAEEIEEQWKKAGYILHGEQRLSIDFIDELEKTAIVPIIKDIKTPLLIMHGTEDEITPVERLDVIRQHAKSRRVEITTFQNGKHGLPDAEHRKMMEYHLMQFVQKYA